MLPASIFLVASGAAHSPAFLWSGRSGAGLAGGDYLHEVSGADLQKTIAGLTTGAPAQGPLFFPAKTPEVITIFLHDELTTEDVRTLGTREV